MTHRGGAFLLPNEGIEMTEVTRYNMRDGYLVESEKGNVVQYVDYRNHEAFARSFNR